MEHKIDKFTKKAFQEGYNARSVFKLRDIQNKFKIIKEGDKVLDLGASPGSWSQYAKEQGGNVTAIDVNEIKLEGIKKIKGSVFDTEIKGTYDVVLSDLSPKTTGILHLDNENSYDLCIKALELTKDNLVHGGIFLIKIFQGSQFDDFHKKMKKKFKIVRTIKPEGSKKRSKEIYLLGINKI